MLFNFNFVHIELDIHKHIYYSQTLQGGIE